MSYWPDEKQCAVSLTYDDALPIHRDQIAIKLSDLGLAATFFVNASPNLTDHVENWKKVATLGHELGNHSLFHPCRRAPEERFSWLAQHYDLCDYTLDRWQDEMRIANCLLRLIDGKSERTFGNTCCNTTIGRGSDKVDLEDDILELFAAARGPLSSRIIQPTTVNFGALGHFKGDDKTCDELQHQIEQATKCGGWIVFMFHGVGKGTHNLFIEPKEHDALLKFLGKRSKDIWTASMLEVTNHIKCKLVS